MIYFAGDIHAEIDISKLNTRRFPEQRNLSKNDYLIICGDFGCVWDGSRTDDYWLDWLNNKNFTTLFVDGNHENFDLLEKFPIETRFSGSVGVIRDTVYHLRRGQVYNIGGKRIFTFGGARSNDIEYRVEGTSWWKQELPSREEMETGLEMLEAIDYDVDIVVTHTCPESVFDKLKISNKAVTVVEQYLESIKCSLESRNIDFLWCFGHFHQDTVINERYRCLYEMLYRYD